MRKKYNLSEETIRLISKIKKEPVWMLEYRLESFRYFNGLPVPSFGPDLKSLDLNKIKYYQPSKVSSKEKISPLLKNELERIGVPEEEQKYLSGRSTQYDSEMRYARVKKIYEKQGVIFESIETGLKQHPEIFKKYFGTVIRNNDNKFAALNSAFWSGGNFVYIPKGVKVELPLETYFRIDANALGQFERTLIIADVDSSVTYIEGCTAPQRLSASLHCGVVEVVVLDNSLVKYITLQNWSKNVFNLVTKRSVTHENAKMVWLDCNIGSKITMKYPSTILLGKNSSSTLDSLSLATKKQVTDSGGRMIHIGENTKSIIRSKSISVNGGVNTYRGKTDIKESAVNSNAYVNCDSLLLDSRSTTSALPTDKIENSSSTIEHEASISSISSSQLNYLMSKGLSETEARAQIVQGYSENIVRDLPDEYSIELKRILDMFVE